MNDWMSEIDDDRTMDSMILPGSHDSGMVKRLMNRGVTATIANACTQKLAIKEQLEAGVRWMDIRIDKKLRCFHGNSHGESLASVADGIISFLDENPTEVVIVLLTKSYISKKIPPSEDAYTGFLKALHGLCAFKRPPVPPGHLSRLSRFSLKSLRSRVIVAMDKPPPARGANKRIVRALLKKYDATAPFDSADLGRFSKADAGDRYDFVFNSAGSYSKANDSRTILKKQKSRADFIKKATRRLMAVYYTTNTSKIGLRATSIEAADKAMWKNAQVLQWSPVAFAMGKGGRPLFNCVMMDFASEERCNFVRTEASEKGF